MPKRNARPLLSRRNFLRLAAVAGVTTAAVHLMDTYAPWLDNDQTIRHTWRSFSLDSPHAEKMHELIRYSTLAANGHNSQPWKFTVQENMIEIYPDDSRLLTVVDPQNRELWISLGCALENLLIAARAAGYTAHVTYPDHADVIRVALTADTPRADPLFDAIPYRQNTRSAYSGRLIKKSDLEQLKALPLEPGITQYFVLNPTLMDTVLTYVNQGNMLLYSDKAYLEELITWLRFNKKESEALLDGLYTRCSGNPEVPRWLGQMVVAGTKPAQHADSDAQKLRSSPTVIVIASETDSKTAWVRTGQLYERLALTMTTLDIRSAMLNQPIEVAGLRSQFQEAIGMGNDLPQLVIRIGYADPTLRSLRRPIEQVIV
jgi:hypothetical protein